MDCDSVSVEHHDIIKTINFRALGIRSHEVHTNRISETSAIRRTSGGARETADARQELQPDRGFVRHCQKGYRLLQRHTLELLRFRRGSRDQER